MQVILPADEILQRRPRLVSTESASAAHFVSFAQFQLIPADLISRQQISKILVACRRNYSKTNLILEQSMKDQMVSRGYSSTLSLTPGLDEGACSTPCFGRFTPGETPWYPLNRRVGGP